MGAPYCEHIVWAGYQYNLIQQFSKDIEYDSNSGGGGGGGGYYFAQFCTKVQKV